jgi:hypothetical protein
MKELKRHPQSISAHDMEQLLAGAPVAGKPDLDRLAALMTGVRAAAISIVADELRSAHLSQISELLDRTRPQLQADDRTAPVRYALMTRIYDRTLGTLRRRAYALSTALVVATGSMAVAGVLPDTVQDALSRAGERVGLTLPAGTEEPDVEPADDTDTDAGLPDEAGDVAVAVHGVIDGRDDYANGHEFGQAVAKAAWDAAKARHEASTTGKPSDAGSQADTRKPADPGSPAAEHGRPEGTGKPDDVGSAKDTSKPSTATDRAVDRT